MSFGSACIVVGAIMLIAGCVLATMECVVNNEKISKVSYTLAVVGSVACFVGLILFEGGVR